MATSDGAEHSPPFLPSSAYTSFLSCFLSRSRSLVLSFSRFLVFSLVFSLSPLQLAHLDVKPGNIFWRGDLYKLGDFGMVTKVGVPGNEWDVEGDSCYLAPEVMKFQCPEDAARADLRKADIFGLGATVFAVIIRRELPPGGVR